MMRNGFGARLLTGARDPWALLVSTFGGGTAWASAPPYRCRSAPPR